MIRIDLVWSPEPRRIVSLELELPEGATLLDALRAAAAHPEAGFLQQREIDVGLWGRRQPLTTRLTDGDRVEAYRALRCDPKEARRLRYRQSPASARRPTRSDPG